MLILRILLSRESFFEDSNPQKLPQIDRSHPAYVTDPNHVDQNPVIQEIKAFLLIDPPSKELVKAIISPLTGHVF